VSEDWTSRFFEECQDISDEQMQKIWARMMAGEVARPGSFSPRTLSVVRDLTKSDASLFTKLCQFVWFIPGAAFVPVVHDIEMPQFATQGLNFINLVHLTSIGLIEFNNNMPGLAIRTLLTEMTASYCGQAHQLKSVDGAPRRFGIGTTIFTATGQELFRIAGSEGDDELRRATLERWKNTGWNEAEAQSA